MLVEIVKMVMTMVTKMMVEIVKMVMILVTKMLVEIVKMVMIVATELLIPSEHCLSCCGTSRKPVLDHKYYGKRFNAQCIQQISGLGTFINNIESIGQDGCMTGQSFARQIS